MGKLAAGVAGLGLIGGAGTVVYNNHGDARGQAAIFGRRRRKELCAALAGAVATATAVVGVAFARPDAVSGGSDTARGVGRMSHTVDIAGALAVARGGKLVVAGLSRRGSPVRMALARYAASGKLDPSFGAGGRALTDFGSQNDDWAWAVAVQADGKVVAAGAMHPKNGLTRFALARYTARGRLDPSFGRNGKVLTRFGSGAQAQAVALQGDGKIVAAGIGGRNFALARYTPRGRLDPSFGTGGKVLTSFGPRSGVFAEGIAIQKDGKLVVVGTISAGGHDEFAVARYTAKGRLDLSFGRRGWVVTKVGEYGGAAAVVVQPDGKIVVAGSAVAGSGEGGMALVRYAPDGKLDPSFAKGGELLASGVPWADLALQRDGKFVTAGTGSRPQSSREDPREFALARCTTDGILDSSFGRGGKLLTDFHKGAGAVALAVQGDEKIVAAGTVGGVDFALTRYSSSGRLDGSFGTGGKVVTDFGPLWPTPRLSR